MAFCPMESEKGYVICLAAITSSHLASLWFLCLFKVALRKADGNDGDSKACLSQPCHVIVLPSCPPPHRLEKMAKPK